MRNFYFVFDYSTDQIGIAPLANVDTVKVAPVSGSTPTCDF